jgi:hypothetical protein
METFVLNAESERFTPIRRRQSTINNRPQHGDSETEWTAARCNRLLRALTSRVAILKRDISRLQFATGSKSNVVESNAGPRRKRGSDSPGNAEWAHPRKKIKKTYSTRGRGSHESHTDSFEMQRPRMDELHLIPRDISEPTPLLYQSLGNSPTSQYLALHLRMRLYRAQNAKEKKAREPGTEKHNFNCPRRCENFVRQLQPTGTRLMKEYIMDSRGCSE